MNFMGLSVPVFSFPNSQKAQRYVMQGRKAAVKNERKFPLSLRLRDARSSYGWSQQTLADHVGTTPVNISRWENGSTFPTPYFRQRLCEVFDKTLAELGLSPPPAEGSGITPPELVLLPPPPQGSRIVDIPISRLFFSTFSISLRTSWEKRGHINWLSLAVFAPGATCALHPHRCVVGSDGPLYFRQAQYRKPPIKLCPQCSRW